MLEFIVLGKIPGFDTYLPFGITLVLVVVASGSFAVWAYRNSLFIRNYRRRIQRIFDTAL